MFLVIVLFIENNNKKTTTMLPNKISMYRFVPMAIRKAFYTARSPDNQYEELFQYVVGRAVLDGLGLTGLDKDSEHNLAIRQARAWFKFANNVEEIFDFAGMTCWKEVRRAVIDFRPAYRKDPG